MIRQSLASMRVVLNGLKQFVPDVFIDTTGLAFTYPVVKLLSGCKILSYTHYPTISTDMLQRVREQRAQYNNSAYISNSVTISFMKLLWAFSSPFTSSYYRFFCALYGLVGRCADLVLVNGTWTYNHIISQWRQPDSAIRGIPSRVETFIVYPPCDTTEHRQLGVNTPRERTIVSVGQFRPEKDHMKQLCVLRKLLDLGTGEREM